MTTLDPRRRQLLHDMGVDVWISKGITTEPGIEASEEVSPAPSPAATVADDWTSLQAAVRGCEACELHRSRSQTVFGVGNEAASLMIVGEAPGAEEDRRGEPFVGRAGQLLNSMLAALGFAREQVFIANILKCRPPQNRDPRPEEAAACASYLKRQIAHIRPTVILAVGRVAAQNLLSIDTPIGRMRGQDYVYADTNIPVIVTYHPAYLLRSPGEKRKVWVDLKRVRGLLQENSA